MSYIKLGQIMDVVTFGLVYLEDQYHNVIVNNPSFPLEITVEVIDWVSQEEWEKHGSIISFHAEIISIPDQSISIRQYVYNQLVGKYPGLVI